MRIIALVAMPHGEHDPDKAEVLKVGTVRTVQRELQRITKEHKGQHDKYFYMKIIGSNNAKSKRFAKPTEQQPKKADKVFTKGAKDLIKEHNLTPEQCDEIKAGEDGKVYKKEVEAYLDKLT
jgi:hypothetical protein